jgi:hypothetical protein
MVNFTLEYFEKTSKFCSTSCKNKFNLLFVQVKVCKESYWLAPVFRIHDILEWIRIRGFMPLTNGSKTGFCYFRH